MPNSLPRVSISPHGLRRLSGGHLWIYANEIDTKTIPAQPGVWCHFFCGGTAVGTGYVNRHSLIAGRLVTRERTDDVTMLLRSRLVKALQRRKPLMPRGSLRLVFSESDLLPGLVVDWYSGAAVVQSNTAGIDTVLPIIERLIPEVFAEVFGMPLEALVIRGDSGVRQLEGVEGFSRVVMGDPARVAAWSFEEDGLRLAANLVEGQKTGYFLDQRDNRVAMERTVASIPGARVLDLFCYSGCWGLRALRAGAAQVTFVDSSEAALDLVRRGLELNGFDESRVQLVKASVFDYLAADTSQYDVVIADPPAFVKSRKNLPQALKAYEKLSRMSWARLRPAGTLFTCSCSHLVSRQDFVDAVKSALAKARSQAHIVHHGGQSEDHPVLLSMPETEYLKCLGVRGV